jgi:hypothetical protein
VRVAFDLDGVLADLHEPFARVAARLFPDVDPARVGAEDIGASPEDETARDHDPATPPSVSASLVLTSAQSDAVWRTVAATNNFWETLKEIEPGSIARIAALAEERRWEVLFITSRPRSAGSTVQRQTQRWLQKHGFPMPSVYVVHKSRGRIAAALELDAVIDDRPDNCLDVALESRAGAILVWRGAGGRVPASAKRLGIAVVGTVAEALDALVQVDQSRGEDGLLDRLRRLFGLRTRAASNR